MPHRDNNTEQLILAAAEEEFLTKGMSGARTVAIAQRANVTHAMLHYYFRTKEQLFQRVFSEKLQLLVDTISRTLTEGYDETMTVTQRIEKFVRSHYRFVCDNDRLPLFVISELVSKPDRFQLLQDQLATKGVKVIATMQTLLDEGRRRGEICEIDALCLISDIAALNLFSVITRPLFQNITGKNVEDFDRWRVEENVTLILNRIRI